MAIAGIAAIIRSANAGRIVVNLEQPAADLITTFGAGAKLYIDEYDADAGSYTNVTSTTLVSGTEQIKLVDNTAESTTWYKVRVGNSGGTLYSDYSAAVLHTSLLAYATVDDVVETTELPDSSRYNLVADLLGRSSERIDALCGRRFYRVPQVADTQTFYVDIKRPGLSGLVQASCGGYTVDGYPLDIISITQLGIRDDESDSSYTTISAGDTGYYLDAGDGIGQAGEDWPYGDIVLSQNGTDYTTYPVGKRGVLIVGVLGFPKVPEAVRGGTVDWARDSYRHGPGGGPSLITVSQPGPAGGDVRVPHSVWSITKPGSPYVRRRYTAM